LATLYFNLYLTTISLDDKEKAKEFNLKSMEFHKKIYGENDINVSNNCFLQS
jgi:hypothetical protein